MGVLEGRPGIARHHWSIIKEVQQASTMASEDELFLGALNRSGKVQVICFLELLTSLLRFSYDWRSKAG